MFIEDRKAYFSTNIKMDRLIMECQIESNDMLYKGSIIDYSLVVNIGMKQRGNKFRGGWFTGIILTKFQKDFE